MGLVDQAIEDRVGKGGVADAVVPVLEGELTGHEGGAAAVAVFEDFEQVAALAIGQRGEAPVVDLCGASHKSTNGKRAVMWRVGL